MCVRESLKWGTLLESGAIINRSNCTIAWSWYTPSHVEWETQASQLTMVLARIVSLSLSIYLFITPHTLSPSSFHMSLYGLFGNSTSASQNTVSIFDIINIVHSKYPSIHLSLSRSFFLSALWLKGHVCFVCHLNRSRVQISDEIHTKIHTHTHPHRHAILKTTKTWQWPISSRGLW